MAMQNQLKPAAVLLVFSLAWAGQAKYIRLDKTKSFPPRYEKAALAVLNEVKAKNENPEKLYAEIQQQSDGTLVFNLWTEPSYRLIQKKKPVNPGGGLEVRIDPITCKIIETLFWQ